MKEADAFGYFFGNDYLWYDDERCYKLGDGRVEAEFDEDMNVVAQYNHTIKCPECGAEEETMFVQEDPCLGVLPGVEAACCGHGVEEGYIKFVNGTVIRGNFKVETMGD